MPHIENTKDSIRSPLNRARGAGSARSGTHHWWLQRLTSVALIPLVLWLLSCIDCLVNPGYQQTVMWLNNPFVAIVMLLFIVFGFYHAALGLQVVIEDYVHKKGWKTGLLILSHLAFFAMAVASIFALMVINFKIDTVQMI